MDKDIIAYRLSKPQVAGAPVWNGEGLPPVGVDLEYYWLDGKQWRKAKVVAHYADCPLLLDQDGLMVAEIYRNKLRPIRSLEEIEREKAIDEIKLIIDSRFPGKPLSAGYAATDLYDAGYRKVGAA